MINPVSLLTIGEMELSEYREDTILHCVREESSRQKRLQAMHKQKSLDIANTDSILYNLDEHRRKSCIDRCDLQKVPPPPAPPPSSLSSSSTAMGQRNPSQQYQRKDSSSSLWTGNEGTETKPQAFDSSHRSSHSDLQPIIPELRLSYTLEDKQQTPETQPRQHTGQNIPAMQQVAEKSGKLEDSPQDVLTVSSQRKEDPDLIDLSSDCSSMVEKNSVLSMSDSDSLVFDPLPPLCIVESDEEFETAKPTRVSPCVSLSASNSEAAHHSPVVWLNVEDCTRVRAGSSNHSSSSPVTCPVKPLSQKSSPMNSPAGSIVLSECSQSMLAAQESPMTLKQKRDLFKKAPHVPDTSLDDSEQDPDKSLNASPSGRNIILNIPINTLESSDPLSEEYEFEDNDNDNGDECDSDLRLEDDNDEAEFKIQIVPRQRKQRKIAVSAIQREYLDISFNTLDKLGEQASDSGIKEFSPLNRWHIYLQNTLGIKN